MDPLLYSPILAAALLVLLASGLWVAVSLLAVALLGMLLFADAPIELVMPSTIWGSVSSWTLTALPLFVWMGEILFRTKLADDLFNGLAPWTTRLPGRLIHVNVIGCGIFAAVSGSSAATAATVGQDVAARTQAPRLPRADQHRLARRLRHPRAPHPAFDHHDRLRRLRECLDRAPVPRRRPAGPHDDGAVHGVHHDLGAP